MTMINVFFVVLVLRGFDCSALFLLLKGVYIKENKGSTYVI